MKTKVQEAIDIIKESRHRRSFRPDIKTQDEYRHHCSIDQLMYGITYMQGNNFIGGDNVDPPWLKG